MGQTKFYEGVDEMQNDVDRYLKSYNTERPHQGRAMNGRTPAAVFVDGLPKPEKRKGGKPEKAA
jgi:hypothetical protein